MAGKIFISYRRSDSKVIAHRMFDRLAGTFGPDAAFIDIDSIPPGVDFRTHIRNEIAKARVVLVVIGERWLDEIRARAEDPIDVLRIEVETALAEGKDVVPVLIERTEMPRADHLPPALAELAYRNAARVSEAEDFHPHMERLATRLAEAFGFERRTAAPGLAKARPATADLVVASPYAGPAVPPPKAGERWEKVELPASLQKLWSREPAGNGNSGWWGYTTASWNDHPREPLLGFCNRGKVGFLKFPGPHFSSRLLFSLRANFKDYWQSHVCFDWAHLERSGFAFAASSGIGCAYPDWSFMRRRGWNGECSFADDAEHKRVFGVNGKILLVDKNKASLSGEGRYLASFELPNYVGRGSRLRSSASSKFAVLCTYMGDHTVLHFPDHMLRKDRSGDHHTVHEVEVHVISTPSNVWCSYDISWHPTRDIFAATRYVGDEETWRIWLMDTTGKLVAPAKPTDHKARSYSAAELDWNSTGRFVAVASEDHSLSLWDLLTDEVRRLYGHTGPVRRVRFSPDGQRLASIGDKEAIVWHPETGERIAAWQAQALWGYNEVFRGTFWAPDARMIATTSSNQLEIRRLVV